MGKPENDEKETSDYDFGTIQEVDASEISTSLSELYEIYTLDSYSIT